MHFIEQFSEHKPCFNPQVIHDNNLQQVLDEDGEEHNFSVFLSHIKETNIWWWKSNEAEGKPSDLFWESVNVEAEWCFVQLAPAGTVFTPRFNYRQARHFLVMQIFHRLTLC